MGRAEATRVRGGVHCAVFAGLCAAVCLLAVLADARTACAATTVTVQGGKAYQGLAAGQLYTPSANELVQGADGATYGVNPSGAVLTGSAKVGGVRYVFTASGALSVGSAKHTCSVGDITYVASKAGRALGGLQKVGGTAYVASASGTVFTGLSKATVKVVGGVKYGVAKRTGKGYTGAVKYKGAYYVFKAGKLSVGMAKHTVAASSGAVYGVSKAGKALAGTHVVSGRLFAFKANGRKNAAKTAKLRKASKAGRSYAAFMKVAGKPLKVRYISGSCYGNGDDGIVTYKNFYLYTFRSNITGKVTILSYVER